MSHYGISVVINVRLYDSQDELKTGARKKTCPDTSSDCELHCTRTEMLLSWKVYERWQYRAYLRRIVYAALHTHMKTAAQPVFI